MKRKMGLLEAWKYLEKVCKNPNKNNELKIGKKYASGLCGCIYILEDENMISLVTSANLYAPIRNYAMKNDILGFCWPATKKGHKERVNFCRKQINRIEKRRQNEKNSSKTRRY